MKIQEPKLDELQKLDEDLTEKGYKMLIHWKEVNGSAATYETLGRALLHGLVNRRDLAEEFCYEKQEPKNVPLTLDCIFCMYLFLY